MWMSHPSVPGALKSVTDSAFYGGWDTLGWVAAAAPVGPPQPDEGWPISRGELDIAVAEQVAVTAITPAGVDTKIAAERVTERAQQSSTFAPMKMSREVAHRLVALGDSITIAQDTNGANFIRQDSFADTIAGLSKGAIKFVRNAGLGGDTSDGMLARFDTDVTPYAPTMVFVMAGSNDVNGGDYSLDTYRTNMTALIAKVRSINAVPVLFLSPPINSLTTAKKLRLQTYHHWLTLYGAANGLMVLDAFGVLVDPTTDGNYKAGLDGGDGIHPIHPAGYVTAGVALAPQVNTLLTPVSIMSTHNGDPSNLVVNGIFQSALASPWQLASNPTAGTGVWSIVDDAEMPGGKALQVALTAATGQATYQQVVSTGFTPGDLLELTGMVNNPVGDSFVAVQMVFTGGSGSVLLKRYLNGRHTFAHEHTIPAGTTAITFYLNAGSTPAVTGNITFGGITLRNLTTENTLV